MDAKPTADIPLSGADDIATRGCGDDLYPVPTFFIVILSTAPLAIYVAVAVAVTAAPIKLNVWMYPSCSTSSSIVSIPVSITSSSYLNNSHLNW